ncbi:hypothetical protein [Streptomyces eurythermus]
MKRLTLVVAVILAIVTALAFIAACDTGGTPAPSSSVEIDIDHHGRHSTPKTKAPAPRVKAPSYHKSATSGRRR